MINECIRNLLGKPVAESIAKNETRDILMPFAEECLHCGKCADNCPVGAIHINGKWSVDLGRCVFCLECTEVCSNKKLIKIQAPDYVLSKEDLIVTEGVRPTYGNERLPKEMTKPFGRSVSIREIDAGSCNACETEINCCSNPYYDMSRFGLKIVASPRHADILLVTGPMTNNMKEAAKRTYDATSSPKLVVACGSCAISGGLFVKGDVNPGATDGVMKANVYIIGCPPSPDRIVRSILGAMGLTGQR